jgi:Uma2 family endonuclease
MDTAVPETTTMIPVLEPGDQLPRAEFERRYHAMPACKKAELIEGVVYMPSPVRCESHGEPHIDLSTWLGVYKASTPGVRAADNASNRLDLENEPQPDCMMFIHPDNGGQVHISADDYIIGPPEFVAEVAGSSVAIDRGPKLRVFRRHGVNEYLIWRVEDRRLEWNVLRGSDYVLLKADSEGVLKSEVFPGLWLHAEALLSGDLAHVLSVLQQGLASAEHQQFVERLRLRKQS